MSQKEDDSDRRVVRKDNIFEHIHKEENIKRELNNMKMKEKIENTIQRTKEQEKKIEVPTEEPEEPLNSDDDDDGCFNRSCQSSANSKCPFGILG